MARRTKEIKVHELSVGLGDHVKIILPGGLRKLSLVGMMSDGVELISILRTKDEMPVSVATYPEDYNIFGLVEYPTDDEDGDDDE